jgi:hypothetical protein
LNLEALEHLFFDVFDVSKLAPTSYVRVFGRPLNLYDKLFHQTQFVRVSLPQMAELRHLLGSDSRLLSMSKLAALADIPAATLRSVEIGRRSFNTELQLRMRRRGLEWSPKTKQWFFTLDLAASGIVSASFQGLGFVPRSRCSCAVFEGYRTFARGADSGVQRSAARFAR